MSISKLTATEKYMMEVLKDGKPHTIDEMKQCLPDTDFGDVGNVRAHIHRMRKKIQADGFLIVASRESTQTTYILARSIAID